MTVAPTPDAQLTLFERERLTALESVVERGLAAFVEVGSALGDGGSGSAALSGSCMTQQAVEGASSVGGSAPSASEPVQLSFGEAVAGRPAWA